MTRLRDRREGIQWKSYSEAVIEGVRKRARVLPVIGRRGQKYKNCLRMAIKMLVQKLCGEEGVGFVGKFCWEG